MQSELAVARLSALAQRSRLAIFRVLVARGTRGAFPSELAEQLALSPATLSFHLKTLQQAGLIQAAPSSRNIRYCADFAAMQALLTYLGENCCVAQLDCAETTAHAAGDASDLGIGVAPFCD
jgi:DNA-binding transcriptional ArsR family regulator